MDTTETYIKMCEELPDAKKEQFKQHVIHCANTGSHVLIPESIDKQDAGNIMANVAGFFIDRGEDIKAIIILEERRCLGV